MTERAHVFDELYRDDPDPWSYMTSDYERAKYDATLAAFDRPRYGRVLEVGCSIGVMTSALSARADHLVALDVSKVALSLARQHCQSSNVTFVRADVPDDWPAGTFDLIVLSEVLYFLTAAEVQRCSTCAIAAMAAGGEVVLVNWTGDTSTALSGDEAAEFFLQGAKRAGMSAARAVRAEAYRLDHLRALHRGLHD